jgi:predicted acyl esterase
MRLVAFLPPALLLVLPVVMYAADLRTDYEEPSIFLQRVPVTIDGERVSLQIRIYKPARDGIFPTIVLNHGPTGHGMDAARFKQPADMPALASFFVKRGWAVCHVVGHSVLHTPAAIPDK